MKKAYTLVATLFALVSTSALAQTTIPYFSGFDNPVQQQGWVIYRKGDTPLYNWNFNQFDSYTAPNSMSHNYPVGGTQLTDDWYVSPAFNFTNGGNIDSLRHKFSGFGTPNTADTVAIYLLNGSANPALASSKILLFDFRGSDYNNDNTWRKITNLSIPSGSGQSYIGFRYKTVVNWLDVRFDNLAISSTITGMADNLTSQVVTLYPNPAVNELQIRVQDKELLEKATFNIYNAIGTLVQQTVIPANGKIKLLQPSGAYFYQLTNQTGQVLNSGKLIVK